MRESDFDSLLALFTAVAAERRWLGTEPGFDTLSYRRGWLKIIAADSAAAFVAADSGGVAGYAAVHPHSEYGHVLGMLVHARHRGRGLGKALLETALAWAGKRGLPEVSLLVFPHNTAALALYRKMGFRQREHFAADVTRQSGEVWDTILMTKPLAGTDGG